MDEHEPLPSELEQNPHQEMWETFMAEELDSVTAFKSIGRLSLHDLSDDISHQLHKLLPHIQASARHLSRRITEEHGGPGLHTPSDNRLLAVLRLRFLAQQQRDRHDQQ